MKTPNAKVLAALQAQGLRIAIYDESGWYYRVTVDGETVSYWITDAEVKS